MSERIFEIVSQSKYAIELVRIENIEDCPDEFITEDELRDMGVSAYYNGTFTLDAVIKRELTEYFSQIKEGKKSIIINDELTEALKSTLEPVSSYVNGTRRVGNRLFKHTKKVVFQAEPSYKNWSKLMGMVEGYCAGVLDVNIDIKRSDTNRQNAAKIVSNMVTWEDLMDYNDKDQDDLHWKWPNSLDDNELVWIKHVYDNPTSIKEVEDK